MYHMHPFDLFKSIVFFYQSKSAFMDSENVTVLEKYQASSEEKHLNSIKKAVMALVEFITSTLEQVGVEEFHRITDPSLDELVEILKRMESLAAPFDDLNLKQVILVAQVLTNDIKLKNVEQTEVTTRMLNSTSVF